MLPNVTANTGCTTTSVQPWRVHRSVHGPFQQAGTPALKSALRRACSLELNHSMKLPPKVADSFTVMYKLPVVGRYRQSNFPRPVEGTNGAISNVEARNFCLPFLHPDCGVGIEAPIAVWFIWPNPFSQTGAGPITTSNVPRQFVH